MTAARPSTGRGPGPLPLVLSGLRWQWRTLTSMRTALVLLALLAAAALPGSLLPQRRTQPGAVTEFVRRNPELSRWLERLELFDVYTSAWFAAVYLLLLIAMTGCVLPRTRRLLVALREGPGRTPDRLEHLPGARSATTAVPAQEVLDRASAALRRRRYRVRRGGADLSAETGYAREVGNLLFHSSLLLLLYAVALGHFYGFEGRVIVVEGNGFSNVRAQYDDFLGGPRVDTSALEPFSLVLDRFTAEFERDGAGRGAPRDFRADLTVQTGSDAPRPVELAVNRPLEVDGTKVFLTGHGYAPRFTVRDGAGTEVFSGPVTFLPRDGSYTSDGVVKVPDATPRQLAFEGLFLPTAALSEAGPISTFPAPDAPVAVLTAYSGDLGLDSGRPQSVYSLDKSGLTQFTVDGQPLAQALAVGDTLTLPDGAGSITFDGVDRFVNLQIARNPGRQVALAAAVALLLGVTLSLTVRQRRCWVVATVDGERRTVVTVAAQARTRRGLPDGELASLLDACAPVADVVDAPPTPALAGAAGQPAGSAALPSSPRSEPR